jgi:hypothetical protein
VGTSSWVLSAEEIDGNFVLASDCALDPVIGNSGQAKGKHFKTGIKPNLDQENELKLIKQPYNL